MDESFSRQVQLVKLIAVLNQMHNKLAQKKKNIWKLFSGLTLSYLLLREIF